MNKTILHILDNSDRIRSLHDKIIGAAQTNDEVNVFNREGTSVSYF